MGPQQAQDFTRLIEANEKRWLESIFWRIGHREDARDLFQDVLLEVCQDAEFDPSRPEAGSYVAWLIQWRVNDHLRRRGRRPPPSSGVGDDGSSVLDGQHDPRDRPALDVLQTEEGRRLLWSAIARLGTGQQRVVLLNLLGQNRQQIAELLDVSFNAANMLLHRGWSALREMLGESPLP